MYRYKTSYHATVTISVVVFVSTLLSLHANVEAKNQGFDETLKLNSISFNITCSNEGSLNNLTIIPVGLAIDNSTILTEIDGTVTGAEIDDLNGDGFPEIYIYINSVGSGNYGSIVAYSSNHNKSISPIDLPPLREDKLNSKGYMGHDEFTVMEGNLARRFPIYNKDDSNAHPTGGTRQLSYELVSGEATWTLRLIRSTTF